MLKAESDTDQQGNRVWTLKCVYTKNTLEKIKSYVLEKNVNCEIVPLNTRTLFSASEMYPSSFIYLATLCSWSVESQSLDR